VAEAAKEAVRAQRGGANLQVTIPDLTFRELDLNNHTPSIPTMIIWHAACTGRKGEIFDSIVKHGVLPKSKLSEDVGNVSTLNDDSAFGSSTAHNTLNYLKNSYGKQDIEGLPMVVAIQVKDITSEYTLDDDLVKGRKDLNETESYNLWFTILTAYQTPRRFIELFRENSDEVDDVKKLLAKHIHPNQDLSSSSGEKQLRGLMETNKSYFSKFSKSFLSYIEHSSDEKRRLRFIKVLVKQKGEGYLRKIGLTKNLAKYGGWRPEDIKRIYIISPAGKKNWRKWARKMPKEERSTILDWENWSKLKYKTLFGSKYFPGDGKLVLAYEK
jgi:hypothetical protein